MGFEPLEISFTFVANRFLRKVKLAYLLEVLVSAKEWFALSRKVNMGDVLLYQHPMVSTPVVYFFLRRLKKKKNIKLMVIIHDLYSLRTGEKNHKAVIKDEKILDLADAITCHNDSMLKELVSMGRAEEKLVSLGIFDYLLSEEPETHPEYSEGVMVAGLLDRHKSEYLYHLDELKGSCKFNLFGLYFSGEDMYPESKVVYHGAFPADELHKHLKGGFGLVWDGTSTATCAGPVGQYLKYNNPHKASSYLAAGFPLIVWDKSALAEFVSKNGIGLCVSSLQDMEEAVAAVTNEEYDKMVKNVQIIGQKVRKGFFTTKAVNEMLAHI